MLEVFRAPLVGYIDVCKLAWIRVASRANGDGLFIRLIENV